MEYVRCILTPCYAVDDRLALNRSIIEVFQMVETGSSKSSSDLSVCIVENRRCGLWWFKQDLQQRNGRPRTALKASTFGAPLVTSVWREWRNGFATTPTESPCSSNDSSLSLLAQLVGWLGDGAIKMPCGYASPGCILLRSCCSAG